jgi:hypothetical protein
MESFPPSTWTESGQTPALPAIVKQPPDTPRHVDVDNPQLPCAYDRRPGSIGAAVVTQNVTQIGRDLGSVTTRPGPPWHVLTPSTCANV